MGGGLMQLVAYGAQDIYLTGNPQITFFKVVYRRHTNFSMECIQQTFNGTWGSGASNVTATVSRNGDLVAGMHLDVSVLGANLSVAAPAPGFTRWVNNTGHALIDTVELEIGGQRIDRHYGHWLDVWNELTDHDRNELSLINKSDAVPAITAVTNAAGAANPQDPGPLRLYVPLKFWFNRNPGLALPLIALQYHEVKVKLQTRSIFSLVNSGGTLAAAAAAPVVTGQLWVDYIYLDTDERRRFAQQSHEYLIEQLQYQSDAGANDIKLNLNHPVKELIWTLTDNASNNAIAAGAANTNASLNLSGATSGLAGAGLAANGNDYFKYDAYVTSAQAIESISPGTGAVSHEAFNTFQLKLNGHDRFAAKKASYFRTVTAHSAGHRVPTKHVYCYSFALKPEEHQPSGTCNFSRIDNARMTFTNVSGTAGQPATFNIYAVNYNVLRIMSGMGGLAYSN
jgi:hypothetical protein